MQSLLGKGNNREIFSQTIHVSASSRLRSSILISPPVLVWQQQSVFNTPGSNPSSPPLPPLAAVQPPSPLAPTQPPSISPTSSPTSVPRNGRLITSLVLQNSDPSQYNIILVWLCTDYRFKCVIIEQCFMLYIFIAYHVLHQSLVCTHSKIEFLKWICIDVYMYHQTVNSLQ